MPLARETGRRNGLLLASPRAEWQAAIAARQKGRLPWPDAPVVVHLTTYWAPVSRRGLDARHIGPVTGAEPSPARHLVDARFNRLLRASPGRVTSRHAPKHQRMPREARRSPRRIRITTVPVRFDETGPATATTRCSVERGRLPLVPAYGWLEHVAHTGAAQAGGCVPLFGG